MKTLEQLQEESRKRNKHRISIPREGNFSKKRVRDIPERVKPVLKYDPNVIREFIKRKMAS